MVSHLPLIYISLIIYEGEHPFICLLTICVSLIKSGTSVQDTTKNMRNQLQRGVICHTHSWQRISVKNIYKKETHLIENGQKKWQAFTENPLLFLLPIRMCLCSQYQLAIEQGFLNVEWKRLLVLTQLSKALSLPSWGISQKTLLFPLLPTGEFFWVQKRSAQGQKL